MSFFAGDDLSDFVDEEDEEEEEKDDEDEESETESETEETEELPETDLDKVELEKRTLVICPVCHEECDSKANFLTHTANVHLKLKLCDYQCWYAFSLSQYVLRFVEIQKFKFCFEIKRYLRDLKMYQIIC